MIIYYALRERDTQRFFSGSDFGDYTPLLASEYLSPRLFTNFDLKEQITRRKIDLNRFEIIPVYSGTGILASGFPFEGFPPGIEEA